MNKFFKLALIFLSIIFANNISVAQTLEAEFVKQEVIKAVEADMIQKGFVDVEVDVLGIPFNSLELPEGKFRMVIIENQGSGYSKRCIKALRIYVNDSLIRAFGVPLEIKAYKEALVATKEIGLGKTINATNVEMKKVEVDGNHNNLVDMRVLNNGDIVSSKYYRAGQPIDKRFAKIKSDVQKDEYVTVVFDMKNNLKV
ncbi:hypothetical protein IJE86_00580 [bacterium]|nr:hypothetical protein [bacterium]